MNRAAGKTEWASKPESGSLVGLKIGIFFLKLMGPGLFKFLLRPIVFFHYIFDSSARRASEKFLRYIDNNSEHGIEINPFRHYYEFAEGIADRIAIRAGIMKDIKLNWQGKSNILEYIRQGKGGLIFSGHIGNIDALRVYSSKLKKTKIHALMFQKNSSKINSVFNELSPGVESLVIPIEKLSIPAVYRMQNIIDRGEFIGVLPDRAATGTENRVTQTEFLGRRVSFPHGPWILASLLEAPVVLIFTVKTGRSEFSVFCEDFEKKVVLPRQNREEAIRGYVERYAERLEYYTLRYPYQWFNFYDIWQ